MALVDENVNVAVTGVVSSDPTGAATLPTTATGALAAGFVDHGYVSEDGVTESTTRTVEDIRAWQNAAIVRRVVTEGQATYVFTLIETKAENVSLYYGDAVVAATGAVRVRPTVVGARRSYVIDVVDGTDYIRTVIPDGEVSERGDQVYQSGQPIGYNLTITAYPDGNGVSATKYYSSLVTA